MSDAKLARTLREAREKGRLPEAMERHGVRRRHGYYLIAALDDADRLRYTERQLGTLIEALGWTKTSIALRGLAKKVPVDQLIEQCEGLSTTRLGGKFPSPDRRTPGRKVQKKLFAVQLDDRRYRALLRHLERHHGLPRRSGERQRGLSDAFERMIDALKK